MLDQSSLTWPRAAELGKAIMSMFSIVIITNAGISRTSARHPNDIHQTMLRHVPAEVNVIIHSPCFSSSSCCFSFACIAASLICFPAAAGRRSQWLAVLFAPFGAILRWQLSKLNGRLPKPLTFFPAGTFTANMLACAFDFAVQSAIVARHPLSYWPSLVTTALKAGFMGSLSTVSTFATEVCAFVSAFLPALLAVCPQGRCFWKKED